MHNYVATKNITKLKKHQKQSIHLYRKEAQKCKLIECSEIVI